MIIIIIMIIEAGRPSVVGRSSQALGSQRGPGTQWPNLGGGEGRTAGNVC